MWTDPETIGWAAAFAALFHYGPKIWKKISYDWKNPYFKWLVFLNTSIVGFSIVYGGAIISWIEGISPFDWSSVLLISICVPIFYFLAKARSTVKLDYEASSFIDAIKNGRFRFGTT